MDKSCSEASGSQWKSGSPQSPPSFRQNPFFARASSCVCNARRLQAVRLLTEGL